MSDCAAQKGIDFCVSCNEYPCDEIKRFQSAAPHRIEIWKDQERIKEVDFENWLKDARKNYSCPECGVLNSAYDFACRKCGEAPSCNYVAKHKEAVEKHIKK